MDKKNMINQLIDHYANGNKSQMARMLGVTPQAISTWIARGGFDTELIYANCEGVNADWLLSGKGTMLKNPDDSKEVCEKIEMKPHIPYETTAGSLSPANVSLTIQQCPTQPVIKQFLSYDYTVNVKGESMMPDYKHGDQIACAFVDHTSFIQWGEVHSLDTAQGFVLKRIYNDGDFIRCVSINSREFPEFKIHKSEIYRIAKVVGINRLI